MHRTRFIFGITALFLTTGIVVTAQHGRSGAPKPQYTTSTAPKAAPSQHSTSKATKPAMATQPKTMKPASTSKTTTTKGSSLKLVKTDKPAPTKLAKTDKSAATKVAKAEKPIKATKTTDSATTAAATRSSATTTTATVTLTPVQEKLKKNTNLAAKLTSRLPAGTDLMTASAGFRNLGQFVAAVNVSNNLGISFTQLKTKMVTDGMSLGQAIQALRPVASATIETQRAEYDARGMIAESERQPQVTATTTTSVTTSSKSKAKAKKRAQ
jgi:hypothetical protein